MDTAGMYMYEYDLLSLTIDKENLDRSDMSLSAGFESPTVKLVRIYILYSVYREISRVCCRIVTSAAGTSDNTATDE